MVENKRDAKVTVSEDLDWRCFGSSSGVCLDGGLEAIEQRMKVCCLAFDGSE
jgi:hypothetical protein